MVFSSSTSHAVPGTTRATGVDRVTTMPRPVPVISADSANGGTAGDGLDDTDADTEGDDVSDAELDDDGVTDGDML